MIWPVVVTAHTHLPNGKARRMRRVVEGYGDTEGAMLKALQLRKDGGWCFAGCEIVGITPLGHRIVRVLDPDTMEFVKLGERQECCHGQR